MGQLAGRREGRFSCALNGGCWHLEEAGRGSLDKGHPMGSVGVPVCFSLLGSKMETRAKIRDVGSN